MTEHSDESSLRNQILQLIPSGVGVYDVSGNTVRKEYLNDGYYQMIGASRRKRNRYDGENTVFAIYEDDLPGLMKEVRACMKENRMLEYSFRVLNGDGDYQWLAIRANHVPVNKETERFYAAYYDIDELVRAQNELKTNEMLLNDFLKYSDNLHFIYYPGRHRYEIIVLPDKLSNLPKSMDDFPEALIEYAHLSEEDADAYREMVRMIDDGRQEAECTIRFRYEEKYIWYKVRLLNFLNEEGTPVRALGSATNVDQYKEAEIKFNEEKLRMQSMGSGTLAAVCFNVTKDTIVELNKDPSIVYKSLKKSTVYKDVLAEFPSLKDQNAKTLKLLISAAEGISDIQQRNAFISACSNEGMKKMHEDGRHEKVIEYRRDTGKGCIWMSTRIVLAPDPESGDILAFFYTTDINESKVKQEITSRLLIEDYVLSIYMDMETEKVYMIVGSDLDKERMPETMSLAELMKYNVSKYVYGDDRKRCSSECNLDNILKTLESEPVFVSYYRKKDDDMPESSPYRRMRMTAFYLNEEKRYLVCNFSDITDQYDHEQEQQDILAEAAYQAEKANMAKTDFLSRMSHDIRTPLNGIIGMTALAEDEEDPQAVRSYLEKIDESSNFLLSLVNDILDMSRIESGKISLHPEKYSYDEFSHYIDSVIQPLSDSKGITFTIDIDHDQGAVMVDKLRFNQIFFNLLSNAVKFTPQGGHVKLSIREKNSSDKYIKADYIVSDDGIGISDTFRERLFQPFEQEEKAGRGVNSGSGLGLAIVKNLVDLMGGTVKVKSKEGDGSVFTVQLKLPRMNDMTAAVEEMPVSYDALRGRHILVAEDNDINSEIVMTLLKKRGAVPFRAEDGAQALSKYEASAQYYYDAVLMDVRMPVMDGIEAARAIRALKRPDATTVPIIALTANAFDEDVKTCLAAGMDMHIAKPIDADQLFAGLSELLRPAK